MSAVYTIIILALFALGMPGAFVLMLGGVLGQIIPFDMTGIDFCMTALFVTIFIDQWEKTKQHMPALAGLSVAVVMLAVFGANGFMLPALLITSAILVFAGQKEAAV